MPLTLFVGSSKNGQHSRLFLGIASSQVRKAMIFEMSVRDNVLFTRVTVAMLCRFHATEQDVFRDLPQEASRSHANLHETNISLTHKPCIRIESVNIYSAL